MNKLVWLEDNIMVIENERNTYDVLYVDYKEVKKNEYKYNSQEVKEVIGIDQFDTKAIAIKYAEITNEAKHWVNNTKELRIKADKLMEKWNPNEWVKIEEERAKGK